MLLWLPYTWPQTRLEVWTFLIRKNPQARRFGDRQHAWELSQLSSSLWTEELSSALGRPASAAAIRSSRHIISLRGDACEAERAADPLHRAQINAKPLGNIAHALSTPGSPQSGKNSPFEVWRYPRATELLRRASLAICSAPMSVQLKQKRLCEGLRAEHAIFDHAVRLAPHTQGAIASGRANASIAIFQAPFSRLSILNQWPSMVLSLTATE